VRLSRRCATRLIRVVTAARIGTVARIHDTQLQSWSEGRKLGRRRIETEEDALHERPGYRFAYLRRQAL
jgi:hypothetical protein